MLQIATRICLTLPLLLCNGSKPVHEGVQNAAAARRDAVDLQASVAPSLITKPDPLGVEIDALRSTGVLGLINVDTDVDDAGAV